MDERIENDDEINSETQENKSSDTISEKLPVHSNSGEINQESHESTVKVNENAKKSVLDNMESYVSNEESEDIPPQIKKKRLAIFDSDSESEETLKSGVIAPHNEQETYTLGSKGELILETSDNMNTKSKWAALCDSESSDGEVDKESVENDKIESFEEEPYDIIQPTQYKKKPTRKQVEKEPKKMTGKDALKLRKEIQSESQRMIRETKVSLPYHKPKQFSLKEFLSRRPKLSSTINLAVKVPPSLAIKMPKEQLEVISKKLEEREKEVREFYKSDSGSDTDDNDDPEYKPENEDDENPNICGQNENVSIEKEFEKKDDKETTNETELPKESENPEILSNNNENFESGIDAEETLTEVIDGNVGKEKNQITFDTQVENIDPSKESGNVTDMDSGIVTDQSEQSLSNICVATEIDVNIETMEVVDPVDDEELQDRNLSTREANESEVNKFSDEYDFSIDDLEETETELFETNSCAKDESKIPADSSDKDHDQNSNKITLEDNDVSKETNESIYRNDDLDKEIDAFESERKEFKKKLSISELLRQKLANTKPRLSGTPDDVIDLELGVTKPGEIVTLMKRFEKHTAKKSLYKHKVKLNIVSVESQGNIEKEIVSMEIDEDESMEIQEKPGVRLQKLRNELQTQIAKQKSELWQNKSSKSNATANEEENDDESSKADYEAEVDDILDDEDEEEMSESSEEEEIDSEEETAEKKKKSAFIDEEAEESDVEEDVGEDDGVEKDDVVEQDDDNDEEQKIDENNDEVIDDDSDKENNGVMEDLEENSESSNMNENDQVAESVRKPLRRIIKCFSEDSDDEEDLTITNNRNDVKKNMDKNNEEDDMIPPHQIPNTRTPVKENSQQTQNGFDFDFLTPVSYITGIKNLANSSSKSLKDSPTISAFPLASNPNLPSPLKENDWQSSLQKKLFDNELTDSQATSSSEGFPATESLTESQESDHQTVTNLVDENRKQNHIEIFPGNSQPFSSSMPTSQDLLNICSGAFTGTSQVSDTVSENESLGLKSNVEILTPKEREDERKSLDIDHDVIISQLLDEEEMEKFKKKFDSPGISNTQNGLEENKSELEDVHVTGVLDSDEDEEEMKIKRKKNKAKLTFSDDDSSEEEDVEKEEEIDLHDVDEEDESQDGQPNNVDYDSEENEIELEEDDEEDKGTANLKAADFFDEEAELSESEWGSADEDEKDLDTFEMEAGDTEKFDEKKLRSDLEKIHMRQMLDEDQREVKLLQELLLEDGELHGSGRQRQFKWKNIDTFDGEDAAKTEDDLFLDEEESEEQFRKKRYEREQFLKEKQKSLDSDLLSNSQILKLGHKLLERSTSSSASLPTTPNEAEGDDGVKTVKNSLIFSNKRGSFLNRGEEVLQRIAEFNKVTETVVIGGTAKNSRKFLFQTVSVEERSASLLKDKKRKATDGTPNVIKKLRLSENLSPANRRKKFVEPKAKTKLF